MTKCAILGASGHGKVIAELAELNGYSEITFFDDAWPSLQALEYWPVVGDTESLERELDQYDLVVIAIGNNSIRLEKQQHLASLGGQFGVLIHPTSTVSKYATIGQGSVVMANAAVGPFAKMAQSCIINTAAVVEHDCVISAGVHISPGAKLAGAVVVKERAWIGIGSSVKQLISIGEGSIVGAGAVVINDVSSCITVVGSPARPINI